MVKYARISGKVLSEWVVKYSRMRSMMQEAGPLVAAIENATGQKAEVIGKPNRIIMDEAVSRLKVEHKDCIVVGDFLMTDILAAQNAGMASALILTGVSKRDDIAVSPCTPTWVVADYSELERDVYQLLNI